MTTEEVLTAAEGLDLKGLRKLRKFCRNLIDEKVAAGVPVPPCLAHLDINVEISGWEQRKFSRLVYFTSHVKGERLEGHVTVFEDPPGNYLYLKPDLEIPGEDCVEMLKKLQDQLGIEGKELKALLEYIMQKVWPEEELDQVEQEIDKAWRELGIVS